MPAFFEGLALISPHFKLCSSLLYLANRAERERMKEEEKEKTGKQRERERQTESKKTKNTGLWMAFCFTDRLPFKRKASSHWSFLFFSPFLSLSRTRQPNLLIGNLPRRKFALSDRFKRMQSIILQTIEDSCNLKETVHFRSFYFCLKIKKRKISNQR